MKIGFLKKLPKDKLQKLVLICIVLLIAVAGVIQFYVLKNWSALADTRARVAKLTDQIQQAERKARVAKEDVAYRADVKSFVETQRAAMISGDPFAWVVREISLLAQQHPVRITGLYPGSKGEAIGPLESPTYIARMDFSGTYDQIGAFVRDLENRFPTGEIHSLSVSGSADDKGQHRVVLDITLRLQPTESARNAEAKKKT
jgi:Tfp pilus assembly protein PilO